MAHRKRSRKPKFVELDNFGDLIDKSKVFAPKKVEPRTKNQAILLDTINKNLITFIIGCAGTGKGHISIGSALNHLYKGYVKKVILTRPVVEVGATMGYLPGTSEQKLNVYLVPLYDEIKNFCPPDESEQPDVEVVPLNYMRGRTFKDTFVVMDEMQNATYEQLKMALTRFGPGSKFVINGDISQSDLPNHKKGALFEIISKLENMDLIGIVKLGREDIVRHEIVGRMLDRLGD